MNICLTYKYWIKKQIKYVFTLFPVYHEANFRVLKQHWLFSFEKIYYIDTRFVCETLCILVRKIHVWYYHKTKMFFNRILTLLLPSKVDFGLSLCTSVLTYTGYITEVIIFTMGTTIENSQRFSKYTTNIWTKVISIHCVSLC